MTPDFQRFQTIHDDVRILSMVQDVNAQSFEIEL